ncbi:gem-associated protein 6-like [Frankliniella occidentalis]|uniref:Gem-associated protein 6-like n=1 Tax=Frankliniella occidentalis TaxID=133901 RepID=A0A6J1RWI1_FRAOC|nr:gem-associated protein 6-like [Frankliniella occidentalis]
MAEEDRSASPENAANKSKVYVNDPLHFKSFVNRYVEVKTNLGASLKGYVYTIDPVSESVILLRRQDDRISMDIIVGHSVSTIAHLPSDDASCDSIPDELLFVTEEQISDDESERRRVQLKAWLCANHIPVVEDGNMLVMEDVIVIDSPYGLKQCFVSNDVIMERVHNLLKQMPWITSGLLEKCDS